VSVLPSTMPPRNRLLRHFFVDEDKHVTMHVTEAFSAAAVLAFLFRAGYIPFSFFVPVIIVCPVPLLYMCARHQSLSYLWHSLCFGSPCHMMRAAPAFMWKLGQHAHPLDAGLHLIVTIAGSAVSVLYESNIPILALWGMHSIFLLAGLFEVFFVNKWNWRIGTPWWLMLQLSGLAIYVTDVFCDFSEGLGQSSGHATLAVVASSLLWFGLLCTLTFKTHWTVVLEFFHNWQQRHGHFTLNPIDNNQAV